jgi:hypothetical protein
MGNLINQSCHDETDKLASIQTMRSTPHRKGHSHIYQGSIWWLS